MFEASDQNSQKCIKKTTRLRLPIWEEEFSVILPETDEEKTRRVAEKIRIAIEKLEISHASSKISQWVTISLDTTTMVPMKYTPSLV